MTLTSEQIEQQATRVRHPRVVQEITEECQCGGCGYPMYVGDKVYDVGGEAACGWICAEWIEKRQDAREAAIASVLGKQELDDNTNGGAM